MSQRDTILKILQANDHAGHPPLALVADAILEALTAGNEPVYQYKRVSDGDIEEQAWVNLSHKTATRILDSQVHGEESWLVIRKLFPLPPDAQAIIAQKDAEIAELQAWKVSALATLVNLDLQAIGEELGLQVGETITAQILPGICGLKAKRDALLAQLPDGMKHCTIQFKECEIGHGWLTATNWVEHGCPTCERDALRKDVEIVKIILTNHREVGAYKDTEDTYTAGWTDAVNEITWAFEKAIAAQSEVPK